MLVPPSPDDEDSERAEINWQNNLKDEGKDKDVSKPFAQDSGHLFSMSTCVHAILAISAVLFFIFAAYLSNQDITQLVCQSIPLAALVFGFLTIFILCLGVLANCRRWILGFYIHAVTLMILLLAEVFLVCACVFEKYEILSTSDVYWKKLDDRGKSQVMANWHCCGWYNTCDVSDASSIYHTFRHYEGVSCFDMTKTDIQKWMTDVISIFVPFIVFHFIYVMYICTWKVRILKNSRKEAVKEGVMQELGKNLSSSISENVKRFSYFSTIPITIEASEDKHEEV